MSESAAARSVPFRYARFVRNWRDDRASQIVEFAVSLPLLVLFVVGIFDFSSALSIKQKLTNAAREGARVAASDPASDLSNPSSVVPASVSDAFQVVDNYLLSEKINDCGLQGSTPPVPTGLKWTYASSGSGCPGSGITLLIDRGCTSVMSEGAATVNIIGTCITINYAYKWEFNNVASGLGWTASGPSLLTATAGSFNEN